MWCVSKCEGVSYRRHSKASHVTPEHHNWLYPTQLFTPEWLINILRDFLQDADSNLLQVATLLLFLVAQRSCCHVNMVYTPPLTPAGGLIIQLPIPIT